MASVDAPVRVDLRSAAFDPATVAPDRRVLLQLGMSPDPAPEQPWWPQAMRADADGEIHLVFEPPDLAMAPWQPALYVAKAVATTRGARVCVDFYGDRGALTLMADEVAAILAGGGSVRLGPSVVVKFFDDPRQLPFALKCRGVSYTPDYTVAFLEAQGDHDAFIVDEDYDYAACVADFKSIGIEYVVARLDMYGVWPVLTERQWLDLRRDLEGTEPAPLPAIVNVTREDYDLSDADYRTLWAEPSVRATFFHRYAPRLGLEVSQYARLIEDAPTRHMRELVLMIGAHPFALSDLAHLPEPPTTVRVDVVKPSRGAIPFLWSAVLSRLDAAGLTSYLTRAAQMEVALFDPVVPEATHFAGFYASRQMLGLAPGHGLLSGFHAVAKWQNAPFVRIMETSDGQMPAYFVEQPSDGDPFYANVVFVFARPIELTVRTKGITIRFDNPDDQQTSVFHGEPYRLYAED